MRWTLAAGQRSVNEEECRQIAGITPCGPWSVRKKTPAQHPSQLAGHRIGARWSRRGLDANAAQALRVEVLGKRPATTVLTVMG